MQHKPLVAAAIAGLFALGAASGGALAAAAAGMVKCFGGAKAGKHACGSHKTAPSGAGQSQMAHGPHDFKYVKTGTCTKMGGKLSPA